MIIDFHTHVFPDFFIKNRMTLLSDDATFNTLYNASDAQMIGVEQLIRQMNENKIEKSVIFGFPWQKTDHFRRHNDYIIEAVSRYPERLIGFCCFSATSPDRGNETERCLDSGLSGVGELAIYDSGLSPKVIDALQTVMAICVERDVPLLLHTNEPIGHHYAGKAPITLFQIYRFVKAYSRNKIILAHWGGGIFFYSLLKKEVKQVLKLVWVDTAASPFLYGSDIYKIAGDIFGYDKILFGSDFPLISPQRYFEEMKTTDISQDQFKQITSINALNLLKLSAND